MRPRSRRAARSLGMREAAGIAGNLARDLRATRRRRRLKQSDLADKVGVSQAQVSALEAGEGARTSIETWIAIGIALERPVAIGFSRDTVAPLQDAGHLAAQELLIRLATAAGWQATFEGAEQPGRSMARDRCRVATRAYCHGPRRALEPPRRPGRRGTIQRSEARRGSSTRTRARRNVLAPRGHGCKPSPRPPLPGDPPCPVHRLVLGVGPCSRRRGAATNRARPRLDRRQIGPTSAAQVAHG